MELTENGGWSWHRRVYGYIREEWQYLIIETCTKVLDDGGVEWIAFFLAKLNAMCIVIQDVVEMIAETLDGILGESRRGRSRSRGRKY